MTKIRLTVDDDEPGLFDADLFELQGSEWVLIDWIMGICAADVDDARTYAEEYWGEWSEPGAPDVLDTGEEIVL